MRNREAIIRTAATLLASEGTQVSLERIAEAAGVGVGTIYRRFRSIDELVAAVLMEKTSEFADRAEKAAADARDTPWESFEAFVLYMLEQQASDRAFGEALLRPASGLVDFEREITRAMRASQTLVARARAAGVLREGFRHSDLRMLMLANSGLASVPQGEQAPSWRRLAMYLLDSFKARD